MPLDAICNNSVRQITGASWSMVFAIFRFVASLDHVCIEPIISANESIVVVPMMVIIRF